MKMKTLALLSLSLAVALALPALHLGEEQSPVLTKENRRPLLGDLVPAQGHVEVEKLAPQAIPPPKEEQEKVTEADKKQNMVELEVKVKADGEQEVKAEPEVKMEKAVVVELKVKKKLDIKVEEKFEAQQKVKAEVPVEVEVKLVNAKAGVNPEGELKDDPAFRVESADPALEEEEDDMEDMDLEPLDGNNPLEPLPEDEEGFMRKRDYVLDEEPVMEMMEEPVSLSENYFPNEDAKMAVTPEEHKVSVAGDEKPLVQLYEEPETEDQVVLDEGDPAGLVLEGENQALMGDGATRHRPDRSHLCLVCLSKRAMQEQRSCPGVVLGGKCYEFFKEPMRAADAELFCQEKFPGGHLASITSQYIHSKLMEMILKKNGKLTRTWVGGLRFLETGRFIWLDGSKWEYADWLSGEPNNTANKENCLEVLAYANGKFNDFTCWEPQAFICSYYY